MIVNALKLQNPGFISVWHQSIQQGKNQGTIYLKAHSLQKMVTESTVKLLLVPIQCLMNEPHLVRPQISLKEESILLKQS